MTIGFIKMKCNRLANTYCNKCDLFTVCKVHGNYPKIPNNLGNWNIYNPHKTI